MLNRPRPTEGCRVNRRRRRRNSDSSSGFAICDSGNLKQIKQRNTEFFIIPAGMTEHAATVRVFVLMSEGSNGSFVPTSLDARGKTNYSYRKWATALCKQRRNCQDYDLPSSSREGGRSSGRANRSVSSGGDCGAVWLRAD